MIRLLCALVCLLPFSAHAAVECVVVLHGIARSSAHMQPLADDLQQHGYRVLNVDYPSTEYPLEILLPELEERLADSLQQCETVHYVGYSMGGLLARGLAGRHPRSTLGRVVQLAPPNHGSEVADFLLNNSLYRWVYGPAGQQLTTHNEATQTLLGKVDYELGVVAGIGSIDPISSFIIPGPDDGKVAISRTKVDGMSDHIIIPGSHSFFPSNTEVQQQTRHFLTNGHFKRPN